MALRTVLVTGSTSGIGLGVASFFGQKGYNVVLNGFGDSAAAVKAVEQVCVSGNKVSFVDADLMQASGCRKLVTEAAAAFGTLDVLINNAGIQHPAPVESFPEDKWDAIMALNLSSVFHTSKAAIPFMRKQQFGRIVNISSVHGLVASANKSAYVAAKHGVIGFTKTLALELADTNITANCVCPGWVLTPLVEAQFKARSEAKGISYDAAAEEMVGEKMPTKKCASAEEIAAACAYLAADLSYSTRGIALPVDGCWTSQ